MNRRKNDGITLIAIVITIIVLIILAGVSINLLIGGDGIITRAKDGVANYKTAEQNEMNILANYENQIENVTKRRSSFNKWSIYRCGWKNSKNTKWIYTKHYYWRNKDR